MERAGKAVWLFIFITRLMSVVLFPCCLPAREGWLVSRDVQGELCLQEARLVLLDGEKIRRFTGGSKDGSRGVQEDDAMENPKGTKGDALLDGRWQMPGKCKLPAHPGYSLWRKKYLRA